ncbi:MAG: phosphotransferase [Chloroflexi bacterium]|nr:phosphotransferase [Chloroflexota bacterium]
MTAQGSSDFATSICEAFGLGTPHGEMAPVAGGLTHRMWRLETDRRPFAVKEINIDPTETWQAAWIERAFTLEHAAFEAGVPMPRPVPAVATGLCLAEVPRRDGSTATVRVHEWAEGEGLHHTVYPADVASRVAGMIARIHMLGMPAPETLAEALTISGDEHWRVLAERVERSDIEWRWEFRGILHTVRELEAYVEASRSDTTPLIMSHRDADQKNWMKTPAGELLLVDWDAAGRVHPRHEVAGLALRWAGVGLAEPDWKIVRAWIRAYRAAGAELDRIQPGDLGEFVSVAIWWFEYNVRRALGERARDEADRRLGIDMTRREFKSLPRVLGSIERWARVLEEE